MFCENEIMFREFFVGLKNTGDIDGVVCDFKRRVLERYFDDTPSGSFSGREFDLFLGVFPDAFLENPEGWVLKDRYSRLSIDEVQDEMVYAADLQFSSALHAADGLLSYYLKLED